MPLKDDWDIEDKITVEYMNTIYDEFSDLYESIVGIPYNYTPIQNGDFWFIEDLNMFEIALYSIPCPRYDINDKRKYWYNLNNISYLDLNRWCKRINTIDKYKERILRPSANVFPSVNTFAGYKGGI